MILLEFIILLIGLFISLLALTKSDSMGKKNSKKILAISYILLCILTIILISIKSDDAEDSGLKLFNTLEKVITEQSDTLITLMDSINAI